MKREAITGLFFLLIAISMLSIVSAYTCPAGSHTFSGGTQASDASMCIPDVGASGPVSGAGSSASSSSGSSSSSGETFTPSDEGAITASGDTAQTQAQGQALDSQVDSEVERLYGTSIYAQAKKLYDDSVSANWDDFDAVSDQVSNMDDYGAIDSLKRAYNVRAINRLNQVWNSIIELEETYADQLKEEQAAQQAQNQEPTQIDNGQNPNTNTQNIPQFQSMIDFDFNFQPMTMTLSQSQINMLGGLPPAKIHDLFNSARNNAIQTNPSLSTLANANFQNSPLANKLNKENPDISSKLQKSISLPSQAIGNFMNQQAQILLGI